MQGITLKGLPLTIFCLKFLTRGSISVVRKNQIFNGELGIEMNVLQSKLAKSLIVVAAVGALVAGSTYANAASKTITCYKGTTVKKVTTAKCPTGFTTTAPKAAPAPAKAGAGTTAGAVAINATYKGSMKLVWSDSDVKVSSITATGTGTTAGLASLSGTGSSAPSSQCDAIIGTGVLGSGADTVKVTFDSGTQGCADSDAAPANVTLKGNAVVNGGTGKYAGATGTLKATGSFAVKSTSAGFTETQALTLTLVGNIVTK